MFKVEKDNEMKKILFIIAMVFAIGLTVNAQGRDGFLNGRDDGYEDRSFDDGRFPAVLGGTLGGLQGDQEAAPLGNGLLIITALGTVYAVTRKRK